jgi:hypothetical protein
LNDYADKVWQAEKRQMKRIYEYILNGLRNSREFYDLSLQGTFEDYLLSLQTSVKELRKSYRTDLVSVDYSKPDIQAAYLIAYYPHYAEMALEIFRLLSSELDFGQEIEACFFGAGPCPEAVGLVQFLVEQSSKTRKLMVNVYDIASETWTSTRRVTETFVIPKLWQGQFSISSRNLDFCVEKSFEPIKSTIKTCKLFVFQNCLNEIANTPLIQENIKFLFDSAPLGSMFIIADLLYDQNFGIVEEIKRRVEARNDFEILQEGNLMVTSSLPIPQTIKVNVLTGEDGLIPRSKIRFMFLALRKDEQVSNYFDIIPF